MNACLWPASGLPLAHSPNVRYLLIMTQSLWERKEKDLLNRKE